MNPDRDFWEKCAVLQCLKNEALGEKDTGSYYDDEQCSFLMELSERDLIRCAPMPGHKIRIIACPRFNSRDADAHRKMRELVYDLSRNRLERVFSDLIREDA